MRKEEYRTRLIHDCYRSVMVADIISSNMGALRGVPWRKEPFESLLKSATALADKLLEATPLPDYDSREEIRLAQYAASIRLDKQKE